jgi:hypothetical protein
MLQRGGFLRGRRAREHARGFTRRARDRTHLEIEIGCAGLN